MYDYIISKSRVDLTDIDEEIHRKMLFEAGSTNKKNHKTQRALTKYFIDDKNLQEIVSSNDS
jgi:hypothetical protein